MKTQKQVRDSFWESFPQFRRGPRAKRQNDYNATIRTAFVEYVDFLAESGQISEKLADRVTL